jgi:hypothetical protein
MVSPDAAGPFIAPGQQEAVTEQTSLSLSLTAVRAVTERRELKDGLQEVPKDGKWSRRHFSFPGNCLHLRDISTLGQYTKRATIKTQSPT